MLWVTVYCLSVELLWLWYGIVTRAADLCRLVYVCAEGPVCNGWDLLLLSLTAFCLLANLVTGYPDWQRGWEQEDMPSMWRCVEIRIPCVLPRKSMGAGGHGPSGLIPFPPLCGACERTRRGWRHLSLGWTASLRCLKHLCLQERKENEVEWQSKRTGCPWIPHWLETHPSEATSSFQTSLSSFVVLPNENDIRLLPQPDYNDFTVENDHLHTSEALMMFAIGCIKPLKCFQIKVLP